MWLGFSKSLGGGFRVGVGTRLFSSSRRSRGPTQRDLARIEKAEFLKKIAAEANELLSQLLVNNNIDPDASTKMRLDLDKLFEKTDQLSSYQEFVAHIKEVQEVVSKISYGGNLTANRRDRLVDLIFQMREVVSKTGPGLNVIADEVAEKYGRIGVKFIAGAYAFLFVSSIFDKNFNFFHSLFVSAIAAGIVYVPAHFVMKYKAKKEYEQRAVARMKEVYGLER